MREIAVGLAYAGDEVILETHLQFLTWLLWNEVGFACVIRLHVVSWTHLKSHEQK